MSENASNATAPQSTTSDFSTTQSQSTSTTKPNSDIAFISAAQGKNPQYAEKRTETPLSTETSKEAPKEPIKPAVDTETQKFLADQKLELGDLATDERIAPLISGYRDLHGKHAQLQSEGNRYEQLIKDIQLVNNKPPEPADKPIELSPIQSLDKKYETSITPILQNAGVNNLTELRNKYPQVYEFLKIDALVETYNGEYLQAVRDEIDWKFSKEKRDKETHDAKTRLQSEGERVKGLMSDNFRTAEQADPNIRDNFTRSGVSELIDYLSKLNGYPTEYYFADKTVFNQLAKMAKAVSFMDSLPDHNKKIEEGYEKKIARAKNNEQVGQSEPLPSDHNFIRMAQRYTNH